MRAKSLIAGIFLVSCVLLLWFRAILIPALFLAAGALGFAVWQGAALVREKGIQRVIEVRRLWPFFASVLFLTLTTMVWIAVLGGLGHGGRASATVPLKWLLAFLGLFVIPTAVVLFVRYYRIASPDRRRSARWYASAATLAVGFLALATVAEMAGWPPILYAARTGQRDLEQRLISLGVDVDVRDPYSGLDPLTYAAWRGDAEMIGLLLGAGAQVYDAKTHDWPALTTAAIKGHANIVRRLLDQVEEAKARNTALCFAARHGHQATAALLLDAGADLQAKGCLGQTPLEAACETGQPHMIQFLLDQGPAAAFPKACGNALIAAAREQDLASLQFLLERGVDINYQGYGGWTALMSAVQADSSSAVQLLLEHGADPNIVDAQGKTALRMAIEGGHDRIRDELLRHVARE